MGHNSELVLHEENDFNPLTKMWCKVFWSLFLNHKLLKFIKFTEIIVVQLFGSIENEHTFNIVAFMKTKLNNYLTHTYTCAPNSLVNVSLCYRIFLMTKQLLRGKPNTPTMQMRSCRVPKP
jgi:hypothetical protein